MWFGQLKAHAMCNTDQNPFSAIWITTTLNQTLQIKLKILHTCTNNTYKLNKHKKYLSQT